jgi:WhiB family redox-sensing transcriptional regulator
VSQKEAECGTVAGYRRHRNLKEATCQPCRDAHRLDCWRRRGTVTKAPAPTPQPREAEFDFAALPWMSLAACRSTPPDLFFAEDPRGQAAAIAVCKACPVLAECLDYAVTTNSEGIWGGLLPSQLDQVKRRRRQWQYQSALRAI